MIQWKEKKWALWALAFGLAFLLHECYAWTGGSVWAGIFAAANESIWEHAKIISLAYLLTGLAEFYLNRTAAEHFWIGKAVGTWFSLGAVVLLYGVGRSLLRLPTVVHMAVTALILFGAFRLEKWVLNRKHLEKWRFPALLALILYAVCYLSLTVNAPQSFIFQDPVTGIFGLPKVQGASAIPV